MSHWFYITPEEYEEANKNGVSKALLEVRVRTLSWNKDMAINTQPRTRKTLGEFVHIAESNGICYSTLRYRANRLGWDLERAATQPLQDRKHHANAIRENCKRYPQEILEIAKTNKIPYDTFRARVRLKWSLIDAATKPVMTPREIGLSTKEKRPIRFKRKSNYIWIGKQ